MVGVHSAWDSSKIKAATAPPQSGGYFTLKPVGSLHSLPSDNQAADMVKRSPWEPRPQNAMANIIVPPTTTHTVGYSGMGNQQALFSRVTGNFTGTTDEVFQWAAAKWGLPDELLRAAAVTESNWHQNLKDQNGKPIRNSGYGDYGHCGGSPAPSEYGASGPSSFGIFQVKWCSMKDASASGYGGWPWTENSTAYNADFYGAIIRGCYEGWDSWLGNGYKAGDLWGCVGRWYAGEWYSSNAQDYITKVKSHYAAKPWLTWTDHGTEESAAPALLPPSQGASTQNNSNTHLAKDIEPPSIPLLSTSTGSSPDEDVKIKVSATDNKQVASVQVFINGVLYARSSGGDISFVWKREHINKGVHVITVKATDSADNFYYKSITVYR